MDRNANRIASKNFNEEANVRTRFVGATPKKGRRRMARHLARRGRRVNAHWVFASQE